MLEVLEVVEDFPESHIMTNIILINVISKYCLMFFLKTLIPQHYYKYNFLST